MKPALFTNASRAVLCGLSLALCRMPAWSVNDSYFEFRAEAQDATIQAGRLRADINSTQSLLPAARKIDALRDSLRTWNGFWQEQILNGPWATNPDGSRTKRFVSVIGKHDSQGNFIRSYIGAYESTDQKSGGTLRTVTKGVILDMFGNPVEVRRGDYTDETYVGDPPSTRDQARLDADLPSILKAFGCAGLPELSEKIRTEGIASNGGNPMLTQYLERTDSDKTLLSTLWSAEREDRGAGQYILLLVKTNKWRRGDQLDTSKVLRRKIIARYKVSSERGLFLAELDDHMDNPETRPDHPTIPATQKDAEWARGVIKELLPEEKVQQPQ